jgi:hypothetical protein
MVPCFDCLSDGKNRCFHLPVIDGACIAQSKIELANIVRCPVIQQVVRAYLAGDGNYYNIYNDCKLHLVRTGHQAGIDDDIGSAGVAPINQYEYEQLLSEMLDKLGILSSVHKLEVPKKKCLARVMLTCLAHISRCKDVLSYESSVLHAMVLAENKVPCILHLHKGVMEKSISMIYSISLDEVSRTNKNARKRQAGKISGIINVSAFGRPGDPGTYKVPFDPKTGKVREVKFDDSHAKKWRLSCLRSSHLSSQRSPYK